MLKDLRLSFAIVASISAGPAVAQDWTGYYGGLNVGHAVSGDGTYFYSGSPGDFYNMEGKAVGVFGGANYATGNLVYGFELAVLSAGYELKSDFFQPNFSSMVDAKLRLGRGFGQALVYGIVGASAGAWNNDNGLTNPNATGWNVGLGAEYSVSDRMFLGAEYIYRSMSTAFDQNDNSVGLEFGTLQLRVGMSF